MKECPHIRCAESFSSRALAMEHYKKEHAEHFTFCEACNRPIFAKKFEEHKKTAAHRLLESSSKKGSYSVQVFNSSFIQSNTYIDLKSYFLLSCFL